MSAIGVLELVKGDKMRALDSELLHLSSEYTQQRQLHFLSHVPVTYPSLPIATQSRDGVTPCRDENGAQLPHGRFSDAQMTIRHLAPPESQ